MKDQDHEILEELEALEDAVAGYEQMAARFKWQLEKGILDPTSRAEVIRISEGIQSTLEEERKRRIELLESLYRHSAE